MLTLRFRWKVLLQPVCWATYHKWQEYAVIHAAWNFPGKYCTRCHKSIIRRSTWKIVDAKAIPTNVNEEVQPWFSVTKN